MLAKLPGQSVKAIFPGSASGHTGEVIVFTESNGVLVNENTGSITRLSLPLNEVNAVDGGKSFIYIQSIFQKGNGEMKGGMFVSKDWGKTWTQINNGLLKDLADDKVLELRQGLAVCETKPEVAYISTVNPTLNQKGNIEEVYCIFKTINGGSTWEPVLLSSSQNGYITKNFSGSWMERSYDPGWGGSPINLGVAPNNPDVCFAGDNGRAYKTLNGGKTWQQVYSHNMPDSSYASNGLDVTTCYGIHFGPIQ